LLDPRGAVVAVDARALAAADPAHQGHGHRAAVAGRHAWVRGGQEAARSGAGLAEWRARDKQTALNRVHMNPTAFSQGEIEALGARAEAMVDALGAISAEPDRLVRLFLSPEHRRAADLVARWMREAGLTVSEDALGTVRGRLGQGR